MSRKLFNFAAVLSALLCAATVVFWVRSYAGFDDLDNTTTSRSSGDYTQHYVRLGSSMGRVIFTRRDIIWASYNPKLYYVMSPSSGTNGVHFTHKVAVDLDPGSVGGRLINDRSWKVRFGGVRFTRILYDGISVNSPTQHYMSAEWVGVGIILPHGYLAAIFAIMPLAALLKWWRHPRHEGGCRTCRYNLTGNTSGVCPECGTAINQKVSEKSKVMA